LRPFDAMGTFRADVDRTRLVYVGASDDPMVARRDGRAKVA